MTKAWIKSEKTKELKKYLGKENNSNTFYEDHIYSALWVYS